MLLIIDLQPKFAPTEEVLQETVRQIKKAKSKHEWIMVLEYAGFGKTTTKITKHFKDYSKVIRSTKEHDNGSPQVLWNLSCRYDDGYIQNISHIKVCGINTSACVIKTVKGLSKLDLKTTVLRNGTTNSKYFNNEDLEENHAYHLRDLKRMNKWKNVRVI